MALRKDVKGLGMPWEDQYGYVQAVKVDNTIYVSGQLSHDDQGNMVGIWSGLPRSMTAARSAITRRWRLRCAKPTRTRRRFSVSSAPPWTTWSRKCSTSQTWI